MKGQILKLLYLKQLYARAMCGEGYTNASMPSPRAQMIEDSLESVIENCSLCHRSKAAQKPAVGIISTECDICFVSEIPLVNDNGKLIENKSTIMLQNIIKNVFKIPLSRVSILSLLKCDPHNPYAQKSEMLSCVGFVQSQIARIQPKVCVLLGIEVAEHILGRGVDWEIERGRIVQERGISAIVSFALSELVRNPSLKKAALNDYSTAKAWLDRRI